MIGGRYRATKVDAVSAPQVASASRLTGFFQSRVSEIAQPTADSKPIRASSKAPIKAPAEPERPLIEPTASELPPEEEVEKKDEI